MMYAFWYTFAIRPEIFPGIETCSMSDEEREIGFRATERGNIRFIPVDLSNPPEPMTTEFLQTKMATFGPIVEHERGGHWLGFLEADGIAFVNSMNGLDIESMMKSLSGSFEFGRDMVIIMSDGDVEGLGTFKPNPEPVPDECDEEGWENYRGFIPVDCPWLKLVPREWWYCEIERTDQPSLMT